MRRLSLLVMATVLLGVVSSYAAPFVGWDAVPDATSYKATITSPTGGITTTIVTPATGVNPVVIDVANALVGTSSIKIQACVTDEWGEACSAATVPFAYTRHAAPAIPPNTRLIPK